jgi:hypothetical protein
MLSIVAGGRHQLLVQGTLKTVRLGRATGGLVSDLHRWDK